MFSPRALLLAAMLGLSLAATRAEEVEWAPGFDLVEKSISPTGRYGVLLPSRLVADAIDDENIQNHLVDLKTHRKLGVIRGVRYFPGQNHHGIQIAWADDSSWVAVTYEARYGFGTITLVEPGGKALVQSDLGQHIQKTLNEAIARQSKGPGGCFGSAYFRAAPGRKILVRATGYTNPKALEDQPTYSALFQGIYDIAAKKWTRSESRKVEDTSPFDTAFRRDADEETTFASDDDRLASLDQRLNDTYAAVRAMLPPERFAAVKKEQIAWLKELEARESTAAKCNFMAARIKELRQLLWQ